MRAPLVVSLALVMVLPVLFAGTPAASQTRLVLAGASFAFNLMNGFGPILSQNVPGVTAVVEASPNFPDTMQRIATGRAHLGIVGSVTVLDAFLGEEEFRSARVPVRSIAVLHDFVYHLLTLQDTGIRAIGDLRGKRVGIGSPGAVRDVMRWLRAAGLDPDRDVRRETFQVPGAWVAALREKRVDAVFAVSLGSPAIGDVADLASTPGVSMRIIPLESILPAVQREFGARYHGFTIPQGLYPGMTTDVRTIGVEAYLIALATLDMALAYQVTKQFYEKRAELAQFSYAAQYVTFVGLAGRSAVPFHPGAVQYFRERGIPGF